MRIYKQIYVLTMVYLISDVVITFKAHGLNYVRKFYECRRYISLLYTEVKNDSKEKNISFFAKNTMFSKSIS